MSKMQYNCPNCGAPRKHSEIRCLYCGTEFDLPSMVLINGKVQKIKLQFGDELLEFDGYVGKCVAQSHMLSTAERDIHGRLVRMKNEQKRTIDLCIIEV